MVKAQTLGASTWQIAIRVVLPQIMPRLIEALRLSLGPAFLFLISAEAIAADVGLGYRIFLVRRYLSMDVILPYVAWITLLALHDGFRAGAARAPRLRLGLCGTDLMSAITVRDVWVEYGEQIVLERVNLEIAAGALSSRWSGRRAAARAPSCASSSARSGRRAARSCSTASRCRTSPGPTAASCSSAIRCSRISRCSAMCCSRSSCAAAASWRGYAGRRARAAIAKSEALIEAVGLAPHRDKYPSALSGGMQQRLAIAQALARKPRVLLLDEPFGALDPGTRAQMHALIKPLWRDRGMTVIMVTHDLKEAFGLGTRLLAFDKPRRDPQAPAASARPSPTISI